MNYFVLGEDCDIHRLFDEGLRAHARNIDYAVAVLEWFLLGKYAF
jgi:hypothetical protein